MTSLWLRSRWRTSGRHADEIIHRIETETKKFNDTNGENFGIDICYAVDDEVITGAEDLDKYINDLINNKNNIKMKEYIESSRNPELTEEDLERDRIVAEILDNNLLKYHFQPIVNARTGQIYAYEVLMRTAGNGCVTSRYNPECRENGKAQRCGESYICQCAQSR